MTIDIREKHDSFENSSIDTEDLEYYAVGEQVYLSLLGIEPEAYEYIAIDETLESMKERGFQEAYDDKVTDGNDNVFVVAPEGDAIEKALRDRNFTINAIAMKPREQKYRYPLLNHYDDDEVRPKLPVDPMEDLDNQIIRHVTDDFDENPKRIIEMAAMKSQLPEAEIAEETKRLAYANLDKLIQTPELIAAFAKQDRVDSKKFFKTLLDLGVWTRHIPQFEQIYFEKGEEVLDIHDEESLNETISIIEEHERIENPRQEFLNDIAQSFN